MHSSGCRQSGFSLVELMVAMVIGLVLILGAGQLFLNGFQSFRQVETLGDKQAALTFVSDVLVREIRRGEFDPNRYELQEAPDGNSCTLFDSVDDQPIVDGFSDDDGCSGDFSVTENADSVDGLYRVSLSLEGEASPLEFYAMDREAAMAGGGGSGGSDGSDDEEEEQEEEETLEPNDSRCSGPPSGRDPRCP
ncbi:PilW family protein [Onishia taeanensis]